MLCGTEALPLLIGVIESPEARAAENVSPTENAISAVTKILKYGSIPAANDILPRWLSWLPVWEDEDEAVHVYGYFCDLVEVWVLLLLPKIKLGLLMNWVTYTNECYWHA